jgi:uncharacterized surface protein with fasciclin (FAS1) repeats
MKIQINRAAKIGAVALLALYSNPANAGNAAITDAVERRDNLSSFYEAMVNTGVINELKPGMPYTVFAPTNAAFAKLTQDKYPCLYSAQCKEEIADIVRNHIVPYEVNFSGPKTNAAHSIDDTNLGFSKTNNGYSVNGIPITSTNQLAGGMLYEIDGVIADPQELAYLTKLKYVVITQTVAPGAIVEKTVTQTSPNGRVVERTVTERVVQPDGHYIGQQPVYLYGVEPRGNRNATTRSYITYEPAAGY